MQNWLPDAFTSEDLATATVVPANGNAFEADHAAKDEAPDFADIQANNKRLFMSESGFNGPEAIMKHLTPEERTQIFDLVEQDISKDFQQRELELREKFASDLEKAQRNCNASLESFSDNLLQAMSKHMKDTADASARLTIQLAEKIVRSKVHTDHEILVKAMETTLFKIDGAKTVIISVNPDQIEYLNSKPELLERLGINQVVADRRVDMGGCLVKTEKLEWDATIKGQLEYLSELIEEMIATGDEPDLTGKGQSTDEPILD